MIILLSITYLSIYLSIYHHLWFFASYFRISDPVYFHWKADMPRYDWSLIQWPGFCQTLSLLSTSGTGNISHWKAIEKCLEMHTDRIITEADISQWKNALVRLRHRGNIFAYERLTCDQYLSNEKGCPFWFLFFLCSPTSHWSLSSVVLSYFTISLKIISFFSFLPHSNLG